LGFEQAIRNVKSVMVSMNRIIDLSINKRLLPL
jgi:hypothetical protein